MLDLITPILSAASDAAGSEAGAEAAKSILHYPLMWLVQVGVGVMVLAIILCLWRMIRGEHLADKVIAGDTMAMLVAGLVLVLAIKFETSMFYDAALVVAILGFVSTVAFAQYMGAKLKHAELSEPTPTEDAA